MYVYYFYIFFSFYYFLLFYLYNNNNKNNNNNNNNCGEYEGFQISIMKYFYVNMKLIVIKYNVI